MQGGSGDLPVGEGSQSERSRPYSVVWSIIGKEQLSPTRRYVNPPITKPGNDDSVCSYESARNRVTFNPSWVFSTSGNPGVLPLFKHLKNETNQRLRTPP